MVEPVTGIPMLDLAAEHAPLHDGLQRALARVLESNWFILGEEVAALERELASDLRIAHAVGVSSGSDALLSMLMACGVRSGDEVVTTPYSFFATVEAILRLGATPIFADVDADTLNLDPGLASERIGPRTRAVVTVHLFGRLARTARLRQACSAAGIPLLEDAAQAIGAWDFEGGHRVSVGGLGRGAALSFFPSKNLGGFGDGGMVITNDPELAAQIKRLRSHGTSDKVRHEVVGGNFRLDEIQAALLRVKLPHLARWSAERRGIAEAYRQRLAGLPLKAPPPGEGCVWNQFVIRVEAARRGALVRHLADRGIASGVYYPIPFHLQPPLVALGHRPGEFPIAEQAAKEALALPIFPSLSLRSMDRIVSAIVDFFG